MTLTKQILIGLALGLLLGWLWPEVGTQVGWLRDIFLHLIKVIIAPLVFATVVSGIAHGGSAAKVGRLGAKAMAYFLVVTTLALFIGLAVVNLVQPGIGVHIHGDAGAIAQVAQTHPKTFVETLVHMAPSSIIESMAKGDVLQIVVFSVIFGFAVNAAGERGRIIAEWCDSLALIMFKFTNIIMRVAPIGIGAAMAATVGHQGLVILYNLGMLIGSLYVALIILVVVVFGTVMVIGRIPIRPFLRAIREPFTIAFVTTSSESALPKAMENMEKFGVPKSIVGFVMPMGYTFNLDGTTLYLAMASVFVMQAMSSTIPGFTFTFAQQLAMMAVLIISSKGVAAVPRASLVVLIASINSFLPPDLTTYGAIAVAMIFGVDEFMDMARSSVNLMGNCLATAVMARWEGHEVGVEESV